MRTSQALWILMIIALFTSAARGQEVLCDRTAFATPKGHGAGFYYPNREVSDRPGPSMYLLSGVVVPSGGWDVDAITAYFVKPPEPEFWKDVSTARLNLFPKSSDLPRPTDDPRKGRVVAIEVKRGEAYEVKAVGLGLHLDPGEYWVGLTPIAATRLTLAWAFQLRTDGHRGEGIEPVARGPGWEAISIHNLKEWITLAAGFLAPFDEELAIKIEGRQLGRGQEIEREPGEAGDGRSKLLHLRYAEFDPLARQPEVPPDQKAPDDDRIFIVQLKTTPDQSARDGLARAGLALLRYLPDDAYLIEMAPGDREAVAALPFVRWVGPYHPAYRVDPSLKGEVGDEHVPKNVASRPMDCCIQVFKKGEVFKRAVVRQIEQAGGVIRAAPPDGYLILATLSAEQMRAVARLDEVAYLELNLERIGFPGTREPGPEPAPVAMSDVRALFGADFVEAVGGYRGQGVRGAIIDSDDVRYDHVDLASRPVLFAAPRSERSAFHGTGVTGVLFGDGTGDVRARGLLPKRQPIFTFYETGFTNRYELTRAIVGAPYFAVFQSDSTGGYQYHSYKYHDMEVDDLVLEYDLLICKALGNWRKRTASAGGWAKNVVCVGGIDHRGSLDRQDHRPGHQSSFGPADDGRIKPDLVHFWDGVYCVDAAARSTTSRTSS